VSNHTLKTERAMTFTEIGQRLGISKQAARKLYLKAIWKLRMRRSLEEYANRH